MVASTIDPAAAKVSFRMLEAMQLHFRVVPPYKSDELLRVVLSRKTEVGQLKQVTMKMLLKTEKGSSQALDSIELTQAASRRNRTPMTQSISDDIASQSHSRNRAKGGRLGRYMHRKPGRLG